MSASKPSQNTSQEVIFSNPEATSSSSLYPSIDVKELAENLFPAVDNDVSEASSHLLQPSEDVLVKVPGALVHLIEKDHSVELACGELEIVSLRQGENVVAVLARVGDDFQWSLVKDEAAVMLAVFRLAAYWTTLAPNVEDYNGHVARLIAAGSGQMIRGTLWCGDVTVDRLKWGNEFLMKRMGQISNSEISPSAMRRIKRFKKLTKMSEKMASGVLSGVDKVSGFLTSSLVNSKVGKKFFSLPPGEIVLASLDGSSKVCDAVELAGRNVMSTTSVVTTGLVLQRYGEQAAQATNEGLDAAGHTIGAAWASVVKPTTLAKAAAAANSAELKAKYNK
ncbi:hypothetical protein I3760_05G082900 [Carya illinoinensis]|nr:hypothetical protein I3760_05G082900 [Carya illinoinensis]